MEDIVLWLQLSDGSFKYHGGHSYLESVPYSWSYSDLMFRLSEKVEDAVSIQYQLPGEELDPDCLISVSDDSDLQEMYDEYMRATSRPDAAAKMTRLRVFLFQAAEDVYTAEDIQEASRVSSQVDLMRAFSNR
eukprot:scaffold110700_cov35-Prasinocladus_malaysianus.AAC.1